VENLDTAVIDIDAGPYKGRVMACVVDHPVYDLLIGKLRKVQNKPSPPITSGDASALSTTTKASNPQHISQRDFGKVEKQAPPNQRQRAPAKSESATPNPHVEASKHNNETSARSTSLDEPIKSASTLDKKPQTEEHQTNATRMQDKEPLATAEPEQSGVDLQNAPLSPMNDRRHTSHNNEIIFKKGETISMGSIPGATPPAVPDKQDQRQLSVRDMQDMAGAADSFRLWTSKMQEFLTLMQTLPKNDHL
jgi:hypothetical protein